MKLVYQFLVVVLSILNYSLAFQHSYGGLKSLPSSTYVSRCKQQQHHNQYIPTVSRHPREPQQQVTRLHAIKGPVRYSSSHWLECLLTLPTSRVLLRTRLQIAIFTGWSALLTWLHMHGHWKFALSGTVHSILGSALSLLLVFRTNSAYDRFWEGRKMWGNIIVAARDLARSVVLYTKPEHHPRLAKLILAYCICLKQHLQGERTAAELEPYLDNPEEVTSIQQLRNRPLRLTMMMHELLYKAVNEKYPDPVQAVAHERSLEESLHTMNAAATSCERIVKQPVPLAYARHASRFLSFYLLTLPCALLQSMGWSTVPAMLLVNWSFISILQIGAFIEEPFDKSLELMSIAQLISVIQTDLSEALGDTVCSPAMLDMDQLLQEKSRMRSRQRGDDTFFAYY